MIIWKKNSSDTQKNTSSILYLSYPSTNNRIGHRYYLNSDARIKNIYTKI